MLRRFRATVDFSLGQPGDREYTKIWQIKKGSNVDLRGEDEIFYDGLSKKSSAIPGLVDKGWLRFEGVLDEKDVEHAPPEVMARAPKQSVSTQPKPAPSPPGMATIVRPPKTTSP